MPLPPVKVHYQWKVFATVEGETSPRLLTPWADPNLYEFAFDFLYETPEKAYEGLEAFGANDDAREEGWVLCKVTVEPVEVCDEAKQVPDA